jgi:hypothetical protein
MTCSDASRAIAALQHSAAPQTQQGAAPAKNLRPIHKSSVQYWRLQVHACNNFENNTTYEKNNASA